MAKYLLDSDVLIWLLRGRPQTIQRIESLEGPFCVSVISRAEIWAGAKDSDQRQIEEMFFSLTVYSVDESVADLAGQFLRQYRKRNQSIQLADAFIAATAVKHSLTLFTYNVSHFSMSELKLVEL